MKFARIFVRPPRNSGTILIDAMVPDLMIKSDIL